MYRFFSASPPLRPPFALLAVVCLGCVLSGCVSPRYAAGPDFSPQTHDYLRADDMVAFNSCIAMCEENTALALVTRAGCLEGCTRARDMSPLRGKAFTSRRECLDAFLRYDAAREARIGEMRRWCDARWSHVHNRKGCYRASETFYASLAPDTVCGSDTAGSAADGDTFTQARGTAPARPAPSAPSVPSAASTDPAEPAVPAPSAQPTPTPASAPEDAPSGVRPVVPPAVPLVIPPVVPEERSRGSQVIHTTQPAGPLEPPPYAPSPLVPPSPASSDAENRPARQAVAPGNAPPLFDTPKYQKPAPAQKRQDKTEPAAAPKSSSAPAQAVAPPPVSPAPATPAAPQPSTPKPSEAAPAPQTPPAEPAPQPQPQPATPSVTPPVPTTTSAVPGEPAAAVSQPPASIIPAPSATPETPPAVAPGPGSAGSGTPPAPGSGEIPARPPKPHLPMPPANSGQPPVPGAEPSTATPPALMPPLPSMLHQPYRAPTLIAPQIETPPEPS